MQSFISKIENGDRRIDIVESQDFCVALGTDLATFTQEYQEELRRQT